MNAKRRIMQITIVFLCLIIISTVLIWRISDTNIKIVTNGDVVVDINAIEHQIDNGEYDKAHSSLDEFKDKLVINDVEHASALYLIPLGFAALYVIVVFSYIYIAILKPFDKLHIFASEIAAGNLDTPLNQERGQYFGEFTWAFDSMRREIKKARDSERESIENNKTVIATLSHDIKTPISSIRSYSEALEANLAKTPEKRSKYLNTIIDKCDEVSKLTDDLFIHSVSDMGRMSVVSSLLDLNSYIAGVKDKLNTFDNINVSATSEKLNIYADPERLMQICENIVGNSNKYAPGQIDISVTAADDKAVLSFRDYGNGIPEENLPFITQKFYRGNNVAGIQGSGLGLYIVGYLAARMNAKLFIENVYDNGVCKGLMIQIVFDQVK